jgi:FkbM family methyltransferase
MLERGYNFYRRLWRLFQSGDPRWHSTLPLDWHFRRGMDYFNALEISEVRTLVDVGANEGQFLLPAVKYLAPERAIAIEMQPSAADQLRRLAPANVSIYQCAVGAAPGQATCLPSVFSQASSLLPLRPEASDLYAIDLHQTAPYAVPMRTLDEICEEAGIDAVDLLKLDVQGYELEVLRGAGRVLQRTRDLIVEVEFVPIYEGGPLFPVILQELSDRGFRLSQIYGQCRSKDGTLLHADAFFRGER